MTDHYDVIVIGSGAGGGTVTYALAPTGAKVLLLERGGWLPREAENWSPAAVWAEGRYHNSGKWTDHDGKQFSPKQNYYVGGNTKFYGAILFRFRERDFERDPARRRHLTRVADSAMPTSNPGTPGPSGSTRCTASGASTRSSRRPPNPTRIRRSATSRGSPSCTAIWPPPGCIPSRCPTAS